jgi:hypothetical protein
VETAVRRRFGSHSRSAVASIAATAALLFAAGSSTGTAHAADPEGSIVMSTPDVKAGGSVTHTVRLHASQRGLLMISASPADGMRQAGGDEIRVTITRVTAGPNTTCVNYNVIQEPGGLDCTVKSAGDVTVTYTLNAEASAFAWRLNLHALYMLDEKTPGPTGESPFSVLSNRPVPDLHTFNARDAQGKLRTYIDVPGSPDQIFPVGIDGVAGGGWQGYNALTRMAPMAWNAPTGAIAARDTAGVLWYYAASEMSAPGRPENPFKSRVKVGGGWWIYDKLNGVQDVTGDRKADLVGRDRAGVLWLYKGTGDATAPLANRIRICGGWQGYTMINGPGDITGDGKADLIARDAAGMLWLYKGTGNAIAPFANRTGIGGGWQAYNAIAQPGDITDDYRADLLARDAAGVLWLYKGTGKAAAPYATRVRVSGGWNTYNAIF